MAPLWQPADVTVPDLRGLQRRSALVAAGAGILAVVGAIVEPGQFIESYLLAYMWCLGATLGCLALGMVHQLSGGAWGVLIRRPIGAAARVLPVLTVLFVPIILGMRHLYPWTHADLVAADPVLQHKQLYLNTPFFLIRAAIYFFTWNALSLALNRYALQQDETGDPHIARKMQMVSGGGLVAYGLTITFASFDWLMSTDPHWFSTIYGMLIMGGQGLMAMAFLIGVIVWLSRRPPLDRVVVPVHLHDLGNLMLAFVMLWAYFSFSQWLIIWAGNLPEEISWYLPRVQTSWRAIGLVLIVFHFSLPFVLLLSRVIKRHAEMLVRVAAAILVARAIDLWWLIAPEFHPAGVHVSWLDVVVPIALGALWLACFSWQLRRRAILPIHDPQFDEALGRIIYRNEQPRTAH